MEILFAVIIIWLSWITVVVFVENKSLKLTIDSQQKQIDDLNNHTIEISKDQNLVNIGIINICKDIAKKVISIEEKVDSDSERIKTLEMEVRVINYKNSITS